jgi:hypothetical protein
MKVYELLERLIKENPDKEVELRVHDDQSPAILDADPDEVKTETPSLMCPVVISGTRHHRNEEDGC